MKNFWRMLKKGFVPKEKLKTPKSQIIKLNEQESMATLQEKKSDGCMLFEFECDEVKRKFTLRDPDVYNFMNEGDQIKIKYIQEIFDDTKRTFSFEIHAVKENDYGKR